MRSAGDDCLANKLHLVYKVEGSNGWRDPRSDNGEKTMSRDDWYSYKEKLEEQERRDSEREELRKSEEELRPLESESVSNKP